MKHLKLKVVKGLGDYTILLQDVKTKTEINLTDGEVPLLHAEELFDNLKKTLKCDYEVPWGFNHTN